MRNPRGSGFAQPLATWRPPSPELTPLLVQLANGEVEEDLLVTVGNRIEVGDVDPALRRLLPSLYPYFVAQGVDRRAVPKIRALYLRSRARGVLSRETATQAAQLFSKAGVPVMLLKGIALAQEYYHDFGSRPMADVDLMVPEELTIDEIKRIVRGAKGWEYVRRAHVCAATFSSPTGVDVDVHRYLSSLATFPGATDPMWRDSQQITLDGARDPIATLAAEHHLFHAVIHGLPHNPVPPFRWIVDVGTIVRRRPDFDPDRVTELASKLHMCALTATGLDWLSDNGVLPKVHIPNVDSPVDIAVQRAWLDNHPGRLVSDKLYYWDSPRRLIALRDQQWTIQRHLGVARDFFGHEGSQPILPRLGSAVWRRVGPGA